MVRIHTSQNGRESSDQVGIDVDSFVVDIAQAFE